MRSLRAGHIVEVRSFPEIAATLDDRGELEGIPFMPEMLAYCGKRFEVLKRADKTCDEAGGSIRRLKSTVHLKELRCGGEAHGACDAGCLLFWKEQWLKRVDLRGSVVVSTFASKSTGSNSQEQRSFEIISRATRYNSAATSGSDELFSCQATEISRFSEPLAWWDLRQYARDLLTRNVGILEFFTGLSIGFFNKVQDLRSRSEFGEVAGVNKKTPRAALDLSPGDFVQIKSKQEIVSTLDRRGRNAGLAFRPVMSPYCGKTYRVVRRVNQIVDPRTRKLIRLNNSVILDGVICSGKMRRFCPRMVYTYWRDIWLTPVKPTESTVKSTVEEISRESADQNQAVSA